MGRLTRVPPEPHGGPGPARHVLVLGGTAEARRLAEALAGDPGIRVTSSLAGRVSSPRPTPGEVRIGGFGGPDGLARWLAEHRVDRMVDATHPFAAGMSANAALASARSGVPLLALRRPGWLPGPGDTWHDAADQAAAARLLPSLGSRIFLTTGRLGLAAFAVPQTDPLWFLMRCVEPPEPPHPARMDVLLDRGPFTLEGEAELLRRHRIDVLVTKDSGGPATAPKLAAARDAGVPVVVVRRPPVPPGVPTVPDVAGAADWLRAAP